MAVTVLSGTSGALYYKPAGTTGTFGPSNVTIGTETIVVQTYLNLKVNNKEVFNLLEICDVYLEKTITKNKVFILYPLRYK